MTRFTAFLASLLVVGVAAGIGGRAQAAGGGADGREEGAQLFRTWCASCHGVTAQGEGALAPLLKRSVPDLTGIAARNGGVFPNARVRRIIDGRDVDAHGTPDMPVWGTAFQTTKNGNGEAVARARIDAIVAFLETIQKRNAH